MTTPAQAQIEAAVMAYYRRQGDTIESRIAAALTAAAEVGEQSNEPEIAFRIVANATIERCAQAVWDAGGDNVEFHCAAIRALKDKP